MSLIGRLRDRHAAATADEEWLTSAPYEETPLPSSTPNPGMDAGIGASGVVVPLTADRAATVRFQVAKPGYAFDQVEVFVQQARESLATLEEGLYHRDVSLHTAREDVQALEEKAATLQATIEVFRANGDPETTQDGDYVTEQQWEQMRHERDRALQETETLAAEIAALRTQLAQEATPAPEPAPEGVSDEEVQALRDQVQTLEGALVAAEEARQELLDAQATQDAQSGEPGEIDEVRQQLQQVAAERDDAVREVEELRHYIDTELTEWAASVAAAANAAAENHAAQHQPETGETDGDPSQVTPTPPPSTLHNAPELA